MSSSEKSQNRADADPHLPGAYVTTPTPSDDVQTVASQNLVPARKQPVKTQQPTANQTSASAANKVRRSSRIKKAVQRYGAAEPAEKLKKLNPRTKKTKMTKPTSDSEDKSSTAPRDSARSKAPEPEPEPAHTAKSDGEEPSLQAQASISMIKMKNKITSLLDMSFDVAASFSTFAGEHYPKSNTSVRVEEHMEFICGKYGRKRKNDDDKDEGYIGSESGEEPRQDGKGESGDNGKRGKKAKLVHYEDTDKELSEEESEWP
jgi:hypothetical protein